MYTQALACVKTSLFSSLKKEKEIGDLLKKASSTKSFTDGGIYNTCFLLLRRKPSVPGVRIVECGAKEES